MALTNDQLTAAVNGAIQAVYPGISNGDEVALFAGSMQMMLLQGKRLTADAVARDAQERANAAAAEFLAFVASLAEG